MAPFDPAIASHSSRGAVTEGTGTGLWTVEKAAHGHWTATDSSVKTAVGTGAGRQHTAANQTSFSICSAAARFREFFSKFPFFVSTDSARLRFQGKGTA